ncbi:MAG: endonuclease/exonuclease/phosphatase family protein [Prevotella sp.]|nr:endonuclease/exonuclease/phosphatase family protein [Prevotella sp.]
MNSHRTIIIAIATAIISMAVASSHAQPLCTATYNIRYDNGDDARQGNAWSQRCPVVCRQLLFEHPDIFGCQEVLHGQLQDMLQLLRGYDYIGVGRDDGDTKGEYAPIFYDRQRLELLAHGHFWLSPTPDRPSLGWDAACIRICTWGKFAFKGRSEPFFFFNLHMDHVGTVARLEAAKMVVRRIQQTAKGAATILTGDFNVDQHDETYRFLVSSGLLTDTYQRAAVRFAENGTFNGWHQDRKTSSRIDHVLVSPDIAVERYGILTNTYWQQTTDTIIRRLPSDHYPVVVHLDLQGR